jgi:hypothetical protein
MENVGGFQGFLGRFAPHAVKLDGAVSKLLPYAVIAAVSFLVFIIWAQGVSALMSVFVEGAGVAGGVVAGYFIYLSLSQEKNIQFFEGERLILRDATGRAYVVLSAVGDKDVPFQPIRSTMYLTNLGIVAEAFGSGEVAAFVPLDMITEFSHYQGGIRVRYRDPKHAFLEVFLYVEDKTAWLQALNDALNQRVR